MARLPLVWFTFFAVLLAPAWHAGASQFRDSGLWGRTRLLDAHRRGLAALKRAAPRRRACPQGRIYNSQGNCVPGFNVPYCKRVGEGKFTPRSYKLFSRTFFFRLPTILDSAQPRAGEYALNGNCQYIVDSQCATQRTFSCSSCCFINPDPRSYKGTACLDDFSKQCDVTYSAHSADCGTPPERLINTTTCNVCVRDF